MAIKCAVKRRWTSVGAITACPNRPSRSTSSLRLCPGRRPGPRQVWHRQTKGPETDRLNLNHHATPRLHSPYHSVSQVEIGSGNLRSRHQLSGFRFARHQETDGKEKIGSRWKSALLIKSLFLLKVVPKVIDPVMGPFQLGCIKGQIRTV